MKTLIRLSVVVFGMAVFASCKTGPKEVTTDVDTTAVMDETAVPDATTIDTTVQTQDSATVDTAKTTK